MVPPPNQVATIVALQIQIGILRPATMKLAVEPALFDATAPMTSIIVK